MFLPCYQRRVNSAASQIASWISGSLAEWGLLHSKSINWGTRLVKLWAGLIEGNCPPLYERFSRRERSSSERRSPSTPSICLLRLPNYSPGHSGHRRGCIPTYALPRRYLLDWRSLTRCKSTYISSARNWGVKSPASLSTERHFWSLVSRASNRWTAFAIQCVSVQSVFR